MSSARSEAILISPLPFEGPNRTCTRAKPVSEVALGAA
jgi:hypothetical protein